MVTPTETVETLELSEMFVSFGWTLNGTVMAVADDAYWIVQTSETRMRRRIRWE